MNYKNNIKLSLKITLIYLPFFLRACICINKVTNLYSIPCIECSHQEHDILFVFN